MPDVHLSPLGKTIAAAEGASLKEILFLHGVEFPCGGRGLCRGCRVKVLSGDLPVTPAQRNRLTPEELAQGWRLACQCSVRGEVSLELAQWELSILSDESGFAFTPGEGLGVAIDLGTTTLVAQLIDRETGRCLASESALNAQAEFGTDVISRIDYALQGDGLTALTRRIRLQIDDLIAALIVQTGADPARVARIVLVGNTAMHHLYGGLSPEPLAAFPFEPAQPGRLRFSAAEVECAAAPNAIVEFMPCLGGFVGSDLLAGVLASGLHQYGSAVLFDLGTNGEIILATPGGLLCASTAAGPAFEGGRIEYGMRAGSGAIVSAHSEGETIQCETIGGGAAKGICGSGLVDAVAAALELGWLAPSGRVMTAGRRIPLRDGVSLSQADIRQLQLAKGAIAAGFRILLDIANVDLDSVERINLAGAFGNYVNVDSAIRIGLLPAAESIIEPIGNAALHGAKMLLCSPEERWTEIDSILRRVRHVSLSSHPRFQDEYVKEMTFPA
ncbi:MAG: DUF4445 domain-containing protein [bacterium]|nr:DUF4445 domain-containing protein [bacterium]